MKAFYLFAVVSVLFLVRPAQAATDTAVLAPIKGSTVDSEGHPVAGVGVQQYEYRASIGNHFDLAKLQEVTSDADGNFELKRLGNAAPLAPGYLIARKPGLAPSWIQFTTTTAGKDLRLVLTQPSFLAGLVVDEADKPVPGAEVSVIVAFSETVGEGSSRSSMFLSGKPLRELFTTKTGPDGKFRIENFPTNASAAVLAEAPGKAQRSTGQENFSPDSMPCRPGQNDIRLIMDPAGIVEGKILIAEAGAQLPVAQINLLPEGPGYFGFSAHPDVKSEKDGTFRFDNLPTGAYRLHAIFGTNRIPEWVAESVAVRVESGQPTRGIEISAVRGGFLEVAVRSTKDAIPIEEATVNVYKAGYQTAVPSGTNGLAVLRLPPGEYQINAYKAGWQQAGASASVAVASTNRVEIELAPPRKLAGIVRFPDGRPAANFAIQVVGDYSMQQANLKADTDGKFTLDWATQRFPGQDMTPCLLIRDPEHNLAVAEDLSDDVEQLDLRLAPAVSFLALVESGGKPLTNATVTLVFWTGNSGTHLNDLSSRTVRPGQIELVALPLGRRYGLQVSAPGYGAKYVDLTPNAAEAKRVELDPVELQRADRKLAGKLVDTDDKPVAGAMVQINGEGQPNANVRTDRDGRFSFDVCEGSVRLYANSDRNYANITAEAGDTNVVMKLGEQGADFGGAKPQKLKGTALDGAGKPVAGAEVRVFPAQLPSKARTATNGTFEVTYVIPPWQRQNGRPLVVVRDRAANLAGAQELLDEGTNVTVQVEPGLTIRGHVLGPDSKPLANAQINLSLQAGAMGGPIEDQPMTTDAQGAFAYTALPVTENYSIDVSLPGYSQKHQSVDVPWDTNAVEIPAVVLRIPDQIVAGRVLDGKDKPIAGAYVQVASDDQPQTSVQTDGKGRFKFKVCEGQVRIYANSQAGFAQVTTRAGDTNVSLILADRSMRSRATVHRKASNTSALKGKPLPDLASLGLAAEAAPPGRPVLLCLMDVQERPSRRLARLLAEQQNTLRQKNITVLPVQTVPASEEAWQDWSDVNPGLTSITRLAAKSEENKWATSLENLPWLILADKQGMVFDEGFPLDQLESKLQELDK